MSIKQFGQKIFSIKSDKKYKIITIFWIKFKFKLKYNNITKKCLLNYKKTIERIRNKVKRNEPIRVLFFVMEKEKWGYQELYNKLLDDPIFEPIVVVSCVVDANMELKPERDTIEDNISFFKKMGINAISCMGNKEHIDLLKFKPDIIFYQQQWYIPDLYSPKRMSKYSLCCYCSYSIAASKTASIRKPDFFYSLWRYFLAHKCMKEEYLEWMKYNKNSLVVTGHPKLDVYKNYSENDINGSKHYVIYAPHFSVGKSILSFSTFDWSGHFMLEYAKKHPEINWVFKPHPRLRSFFLEKNIMSEEELNNYFEEWSKVGLVYIDGGYFDIFKNSDAMITDCGSFCVEYFFSGKPLLHLISENSKPHSALNRRVNKNHYSIFNKETLEKYLDEIVIRKNDFLKEVRLNAKKEIFGEKQDSAENILKYIKKELDI